MPATTFFGCELSAKKPYTFEADEIEASALFLNQAAILSSKDKTPTKLFIEYNDTKYILCTLIPGITDQCVVKVDVSGEATFSVEGTSIIHLTGYVQGGDDDDEEEFEKQLDEKFISHSDEEEIEMTQSEEEAQMTESDSEEEEKDKLSAQGIKNLLSALDANKAARGVKRPMTGTEVVRQTGKKVKVEVPSDSSEDEVKKSRRPAISSYFELEASEDSEEEEEEATVEAPVVVTKPKAKVPVKNAPVVVTKPAAMSAVKGKAAPKSANKVLTKNDKVPVKNGKTPAKVAAKIPVEAATVTPAKEITAQKAVAKLPTQAEALKATPAKKVVAKKVVPKVQTKAAAKKQNENAKKASAKAVTETPAKEVVVKEAAVETVTKAPVNVAAKKQPTKKNVKSPKQDDNEGPYQCKHCPRRFHSEGAMAQHSASRHK